MAMMPLGDENTGGRGLPIVTYILIALNVLVWFVELAQPDLQAFIMQWGAVPERIAAGGGLITLLTSMFLHGGWAHLLGNMLFLWIFGDNVERAFGSVIFLTFYIVCGLAAVLAHVFLNATSSIPTVGASGAISGVLGAYILMFAGNRVRVLLGRAVTVVPAWMMIGLWIVMQFFYSIAAMAQTAETGGVAYAAHVGGFLAGVLLTLVLRPLTGARRLAAPRGDDERLLPR
jgi:membrane associated rhomboid family serine protease